jgi:drug/metabolite transporter (DMT)-like permease
VEKGTVTWKDFFYRMVPMSVFFAMGLVLGNMAYRYISLAYIQMVKAFTPVPLLLLNFAVGKEHPSLLQLCIVLVVSAGVLMSSIGELEFSLLGFVVQMAAVLSDCCRVMIMDLMLRDLQLDSLSLLYYTAPTSAALIFCGFIAMEARDFEPEILTPSLSLALLANGLLAFSLNVAVIYLVSSTSSMVLSISGPIKDITIVLISVCVFGAPITALQVTKRLAACLCGAAAG